LGNIEHGHAAALGGGKSGHVGRPLLLENVIQVAAETGFMEHVITQVVKKNDGGARHSIPTSGAITC
jgi:hypothetical protein